MAIDGRKLVQKPEADASGYESRGVRVAAALIFWVPVALVVAFAYWSGTWIGGTIGGVSSVVSTAAVVFFLWLQRKRKH